MLRSCTDSRLIPLVVNRLAGALVLLACALAGCTSVEEIQFNSGRGAWNAPDYVYQPPWITRKYEAALAKMDEGDIPAAIAALETFTGEHPEYPGAYVNLAILYHETGRTDEALVQLELALAIEEDYVYALNQKGLIRRQQGQFAEARELWLQATQADPYYANAWYNLGVLYDLYLQDLAAALEAYQRYQQILLAAGEGAEEDPEVAIWIKDLERRLGQPLQASYEEEML